jgi:hypothetical protein
VKGAGTLLVALSLGVCFAPYCEASTNFYVDPDWTGAQSGSAAQPWSALTASAWTAINAALANDDATIYFAALRADGATQQSRAWFIQCRRTDNSAHRLTLDGYSVYNSSETTPNWLPNPEPDISIAYTSGKVFKTTGSGSMALGWNRNDGNDFVTHNGLVYCCIESHIAAPDNEPGTGANWQFYWDQHGVGGPQWAVGMNYKCYPKQNNITLRGFEVAGSGARSGVNGDNLIWEYNYIHDVTGIGPGLQLLYTSFPDSSAAQIISRPSTNLIFRNFRIERTYGEGFYLGSINPDAPAAFQAAHGNQHSHILIENFLIDHPGVNGAQGDAIDCKNGITYLTIRLGKITGFGANGNGINLGESATNVNQYILVERNYIHDSTGDNQGAQRAIHAQTGDATGTSMYGFNGVTIRNNVIANCNVGIQFSGDTTAGQPATYGSVFNNTIYNTLADLIVFTNISNTVVKNNFVFGGADPRGQIDSSGVVSDYNAHDGNWISANEGPHTLALSTTQALLSVVNANGENFHLVFGSPLIGMAQAQTSFSDDFDGNPRGLIWDISAYQFAPTATPTPTPTQTPTATPSATATPTPCLATVPDFVGVKIMDAQTIWQNAGFTTEVITDGPPGQTISWQSLPPGYEGDCSTTVIFVSWLEPGATPTPSPTPTPTATSTPTPTPTPTATATATATPTATFTPTPTPTPCLAIVPDFVGQEIMNAQTIWESAGFTTEVITDGTPGEEIIWQSLPPGYQGDCSTTVIFVISRPGDISTRAFVQTGDNVMIGGFIVQGTTPKKVIIRAIGPELGQYGVPNQMADPTLELHDGSGALIASNDNWQTTVIGGIITNNQVGDIQNSLHAPGDARESAIIADLSAGNYTAIVRGVNSTTGVALVEVYDLSSGTNSVLGNISTRAFVQTGDNVMIGGFIVQGTTPKRVIIRAIGPELGQYGLPNPLADPTLELHDGTTALIASNDNWQHTIIGGIISADQVGDIINSGRAPKDARESAMVVTLPPGNYTAIVRGLNNTSGVGLVEVYDLNPALLADSGSFYSNSKVPYSIRP